MHISDGILPTTVIAGGFLAGAAMVAWSARRTKQEDIPKIAVATSAFFVASLLRVPLGPTSVHLLLPGLVGILLGNSAFLSIALGVTLQALLFQFGGITAIGANTLMMGLPALAAGWLFRCINGDSLSRHVFAAAVGGALGVILAVLFLALFLFSAGGDFIGVARLTMYAHLPVVIIESAVSAFAVSFLYRVKPELLEVRPPGPQHG